MNPLQEKRRALGHGRACFGGDSSSASTSTQNTVNTAIDNRSVITNNSSSTNTLVSSIGSVGGNVGDISGSFNTISDSFNTSTSVTNVTQTDHGAVSGALASNSQNVGLILALTDKLTSSTNEVLKKNQTMTQELANTTNTAYAGAAQQASGTNTFIFVAVGVVALAAVLLRKG